MLCSLSNRSIVDRYLSSIPESSLRSSSDTLLQFELDVAGESDGELETVFLFNGHSKI